jgi:AcrR family transcriptional regulator
MGFVRARTEEQISSRQKEIINACDVLFGQYGYEGINFKAISRLTSFKRTTIYLYYKTKDEVLLDLLKKEMLEWETSLKAAFDATETLTKEKYCEIFVDTLVPYDKMLRLLTILSTIIEKQCSIEKLAEFRRDINGIFVVIWESLTKFFPKANEEKKSFFMVSVLAYILGYYPLAHSTQKQIDAMTLAGAEYMPLNFKDAYYRVIMLLVSNF